MSYKLTNKSGGQIVCDLAVEGKTLRLKNKQTKTIKDEEITPYIKSMVLKGLILSEEVSNETLKKKKITHKGNEVKED